MGLPNPIPDNPLKWDGWKHFASTNPYERLCLDFEDTPAPTAEQIEDHCRRLLVWWQKKLPLKNQPSNPMAQMLRVGMDEAAAKLGEASTLLLDPETRDSIDRILISKARETTVTEFRKLLAFALTGGTLTADEEKSLHIAGKNLGLPDDEVTGLIAEEIEKTGAKRVVLPVAPPPPKSAPAPPPRAPLLSQRDEFLRMLRLSGIDEITDDQRDAFCNMGEALGLSGGDAEDVIDDYLEEMAQKGAAPRPPRDAHPSRDSSAGSPKNQPEPRPIALTPRFVKRFAPNPSQETKEHRPFQNSLDIEMRLVRSGSFTMGSTALEAAANERPLCKTNISAFYLARWPVTVGQYEAFDPSHRSKRAPWANEQHPVIYVSALDANRFCEWLSAKEKRKYRLPTEAEWEYAAKGPDNRTFPWGDTRPGNAHANLADANTNFPWADPCLNDGYAETAPVGSYPLGASPFGMEDMAGNVWEWCFDCLLPYPTRERTNPKGPTEGLKRVYRGGSWKSRIGSLRTSARSFNAPTSTANDVGFRILCEIA